MSFLTWNRKKGKKGASYQITLSDIETVELYDGKITSINNPFTYAFEVNEKGQFVKISDLNYAIDSHLIAQGYDIKKVPKQHYSIFGQEIQTKIIKIWNGFVENWLGHSSLDGGIVKSMEVINSNDIYSLELYQETAEDQI